ncbi:MAG: hypothetical protein E6Q78_13160 [Rhodoferax sp.]|nr:MAG: hypothetical protein E6Q78_13160 [Rhodoferax sp.]
MFNTLRRHAGSTVVFAIALAALAATPAQAQSYVNVSVGGVFSPGVYGQVTFGNAPPPPVYNPRPVVIAPVVLGAPVVYMHVPEEHRRHWSHHCGAYNACGRPVQFVQVNINNRWWEGRGDYRSYDHYDNHHDGGRDYYRQEDRRGDDGRGKPHDNGKHRGHGKRHGDD